MSDENKDVLAGVRRKIDQQLNKYGDKLIFGYRPTQEQRKEGDVWEDADGKQWTIKNGIRQNISKTAGTQVPLFCPQCQAIMNKRQDTRFWVLRGKCMDCVVKEETKMRFEGTWNQYEKEKVKSNYIAFLKEKITELTHYRESVSTPEIIHADDEKILMIEKWHMDLDKVKNDLLEDIEKLKEELERVERGEADDEFGS